MYWIHTDLVDRLPFGLEYVLNTPMAHRMHHRPPGNCNYGGLFIIWDRLFGTYSPELERRDYYGLAKQPNTFDPIRLNTNHLDRMADIGGVKGSEPGDGLWRVGSWLRQIFKRRVAWDGTCDLRLLFESIPPLKRDLRAVEGPRRPKWDGETQAPMPLLTILGFIVCFVSALGGVVLLLLSHHSMHKIDAALGVLLCLMLLSAVNQIADQRVAGKPTPPSGVPNWTGMSASGAMAAAMMLVPALYGTIFGGPGLMVATAAAIRL